MQKLTRKERANRKKGLLGKGWGKKKNRQLSPHILSNERWLVICPSIVEKKPQAYHVERKANEIATAIANNMNINVEIEHQFYKNGEWVEAGE